MKNKSIPFILIPIGIACLLILPYIGQRGLFLDGLTYGNIGRNLAEGLGSFWTPYYSETFFYGTQPPMAYWLQSIVFYIIGDYFFIERLYSIMMLCLTGGSMALVWRQAVPAYKQLYWLPLLFWITVPIISWSYHNNLMENTVSVFCVLSVFFIQKSILKQGAILPIILAGLCIFCAYLTKGVATIFPIIAFGWYALLYWDWSRKIIVAQVLLITLVGGFFIGLITFVPTAKAFLQQSFELQVSLIETYVSVKSQWFIMGKLLMELLPLLILSSVILLGLKWKQSNYFLQYQSTLKIGLFWIGIGLAGSLPITLSVLQSGYYLVPSIAFFSLGLAVLIVPFLAENLKALKAYRWVRPLIIGLGVFLIIASIGLTVSKIGTYTKNQFLIEDIDKIQTRVDESILSLKATDDRKWLYYAYFMRYYKISIDEHQLRKWLVVKDRNLIPSNYKIVDLELEELTLCEKSVN